MYHVLAKETTVTIGERVFSPLMATTFAEDLPDEVAERADLLYIEEVPDEQPTVMPGGLSATGTLETGADAAGDADTSAQGAQDGQVPAADPTLLTDEALAKGVAVLNVGDDDENPGEEPDPFAVAPTEPVEPTVPSQRKGGRGGSRSNRK